MFTIHICSSKYRFDWIDLLCLTPLSAIFQLYHGDSFDRYYHFIKINTLKTRWLNVSYIIYLHEHMCIFSMSEVVWLPNNCTQYCHCLWTAHSWLPLQISYTYILWYSWTNILKPYLHYNWFDWLIDWYLVFHATLGCTRLAAANDKVDQLLAHGRWFSPDTTAASTTKTGRHDIAEILLKVAWNTKYQSINQSNQL
jgi:hypothetical protein